MQAKQERLRHNNKVEKLKIKFLPNLFTFSPYVLAIKLIAHWPTPFPSALGLHIFQSTLPLLPANFFFSLVSFPFPSLSLVPSWTGGKNSGALCWKKKKEFLLLFPCRERFSRLWSDVAKQDIIGEYLNLAQIFT